jgi:hypothetical protein
LYTEQKLNDSQNDQITTQNVSVTPRFSLENYELYSSWSNNEISGITGGSGFRVVLFRVKFYYYSVNKYFKTSGSIPGIPFKTKINPGISNTEIKHFMNFKTDLNRKETLIKLLNNIIIHEDEIIKALYDDFKSLLLKLS